MLDVRFRRDSRNRLSSVFATGHAEQGEPGEDIACAAVSALLQAAWLGLADVAKIDVTGHRRSGDFLMEWADDTRDRVDVQAIVTTTQRAIEQIATQYRGAIRTRTDVEPGTSKEASQ